MAAIKYNVTSGELPITVNLLDEGLSIIATNVHTIYEEGHFDDIPSGIYTIQMIEDNGCTETYMVCEGGCGYGLLYNGWVAEDARSIAADGWHVIYTSELTSIILAIDGADNGATLAQSGTDYWSVDFGTNTTGLSLRGSGKRAYNTGAYSGIYDTFYGWTIDDFNANYRYMYYMSTDGELHTGDILHKRSALGIRLVSNSGVLEDYVGNDGKTYQTIRIAGGMVMTAQNIAETKYANGDLIPSYGIQGNTYTSAEWTALTDGALCPYNNDWELACMSNAAIDYCQYGVLYNWSAVDDVRGIAPTGYHVPTYAEWQTLTTYLTNNGYGYGGSGADVAKSICYTLGWNNNNVAGSPGNSQWLNNSSGFSALSSGMRYGATGGFNPQGTTFDMWTSTISYAVGFAYNSAYPYTYINTLGDDYSGRAVRCIRDDLSGYVEGETVTDYDGNVYTTVQIGTQVWLVENLKVGHYNNGELIPIVDDDGEWMALVTGACCAYYYDWETYACVDEPTTTTTTTELVGCVEYGYLYNWYAATDARGIASAGWHVATNNEVLELLTYLGDSSNGYKLADSGLLYWEIDFGDNATGLTLRGSGQRYYTNGNYLSIKETFTGWTQTPLFSLLAYCYELRTNGIFYTNILSYRTTGYSIRLIKDDSTLTAYVGNDGKSYQTVKIGDQVWLAENLAETKYANNDDIPYVADGDEWAAIETGAMCAYDNNSEYVGCGEVIPTTTTTTTIYLYYWVKRMDTLDDYQYVTFNDYSIGTIFYASTEENCYECIDKNTESYGYTYVTGIVLFACDGIQYTLSADPSTICSGNSADIELSGSELNVYYQLVDDEDTNIGSPQVGTGSILTFNTGELDATTSFHIHATSGIGNCPFTMVNTLEITVEESPGDKTTNVSGDNPICAGESTSISVYSTIAGTFYQLRNDADDTPIGSPQEGNGGTLVFSTGTLTSTTVFNVYATLGDCSTELTNKPTVTVTPLPIITDQPDELTLYVGESGSMCVVTSASSPTYQWQSYTGELPPNDWADLTDDPPVMTGTNDDCIVFTNITADYIAIVPLRCVVTADGCSTPSDSATLSVYETTTTTIP